jgi:predicted Rossmann fold nucleotide-binding protein DprA/Smf involved in DNA uptake
MNAALSPNTQAILLLTAPLITGRRIDSAPVPLSPGEYKRLARFLREQKSQPAVLLGSTADQLLSEYSAIDSERLKRLMQRGFQLSQAIEHWQTRAIWVLSRADAAYPRRLKERLREDAPPVLYGCGGAAIIETGGLAVVGSRHVDQSLIEYTEAIGRLAARAGRTVVSGGARGIDQAAMRGALEAGGRAVGILADSLERATLNREYRNPLIEGQLVLVSPYDPQAGFNVGNAMQRNKLIYALADAALVVSSDYEKGGTWAGAVEQLEKLHFVPIYARVNGGTARGLQALNRKGALRWPDPSTPDELAATLAVSTQRQPYLPETQQLSLLEISEPTPEYQVDEGKEHGEKS